MELLLLRHGKSEWPEGVDDHLRPLSDRGKRDAQRVGDYLRANQLLPDSVISSPAKRALETAEKCVKAAGMTVSEIQVDERLYHASAATLKAVADEQPCQRLLMVGHNPGMEMLLENIAVTPLTLTDKGKLMTTANLAICREDETKLIRPVDLPERFHFFTDSGVEWRDRPQYYYNQSGAIPYEIDNGELRFLLIGDIKGKKWSMPKGIVEPGLSPAASAAKEAEEEAGVQGDIQAEPIATFSLRKWGADLPVSFCPMRVDTLLPDHGWESGKRVRKWMKPEKAAKKIRFPELADELVPLAQRLLNR